MTKKQQATLNMSMIPLAIILVLIIGAGYLLLKGELKLGNWNRGAQLRRLENFPQTVYTDKVVDKQRLVLKNQDDLNKFLNSIDSTGLTNVKENINFDKEYLVAVASKTFEEDGHKLKIKKLMADKDSKKLTVSVEESEKGENCVVENQKNIVVDIIAISKTDWQVDFERLRKTEECKLESTASEE
jgi:hypothetical protein